jgi:bacterioferritin-associated ferredoxin
MYICICNGVTDNDIKQAANNGVSSFRELRNCTGAGTQCGKCVTQAKTVLKEAREEINCYNAMSAQGASFA